MIFIPGDIYEYKNTNYRIFDAVRYVFAIDDKLWIYIYYNGYTKIHYGACHLNIEAWNKL